MANLKDSIRKIVYGIPLVKAAWIRWIRGRKGIHAFEGWGMTTDSFPPWRDPANALAKDFLKIHTQLVDDVLAGKFVLSQFDGVKDKRAWLEELRWRHYVVFWSARYASTAAGRDIVECGVCDGLTVHFALSALGGSYRAWLYDSWQAMKEEELLPTEQRHAGDYGYLSMETTKRNLQSFDTVFVKGYIPESFKTSRKPGSVAWMHIDLNASQPTTDSLNEFFDSISPGGVILFDDYALPAYQDTKKAVDTFFADKNGILLHMPTGQGIFFKK